MYISGGKRSRILYVVKGPVQETIDGGRRCVNLLSSLDLVLGTIVLSSEGVRVGAFYDIASGDIDWRSADGLMYVYNNAASVGGGLYANGNGQGTLIEQVRNTDPNFSTAYVR